MTDLTTLRNALADAEVFAKAAWKEANRLNEETRQDSVTIREITSKTSAAYDALVRSGKILLNDTTQP